jgi:uncharacterized protein (DUF1778 family)
MDIIRREFIEDANRHDAEYAKVDRCFIALDDQAFAAFAAALDQSPADNPRLVRLLRTAAPWEMTDQRANTAGI